MSDTIDIPGSNYSFVGDFTFTPGAHPALTFEIPMATLKALISGPSSRHLEITRGEVVALLKIIDSNPNTSDSDRETVKSLLEKA